MSNVLIGIIGVILFIGLALAGALILGSDFLAASNSSRAAAISSTLQQAANAASMYELKTGKKIKATTENAGGIFLAPRFIKSPPINPYTGTALNFIDPMGSSSSGEDAAMWYTNIGNDEEAREICRAIEEGAGASNPEASQNGANISAAGGWHNWVSNNKRIGCLVNTYFTPAQYQAYIWF